MPENLPKPRNIFEAINQNIYILGENLKSLSEQVAHRAGGYSLIAHVQSTRAA
jgi:uncharacterized protein with HEPN domain